MNGATRFSDNNEFNLDYICVDDCVVYLGFLNIHILCAGGDYLPMLGCLSSACQFQSNPRKPTRGK